MASGEAADLLDHPERATHSVATGSAVHLRPHEVFPSADGDALPSDERGSEPVPHPLAAGSQVAPAPISAQPGEAATPPRSSTTSAPSAAQRPQLRESPSAGDPAEHVGHLEARASAVFSKNHFAAKPPSRLSGAEQSNTSIIYGDQLILKLFRRLQPGENPDVEIGRYLTETVKFSHVPLFLGEIAIIPTNGEKTTTAVLQGLVSNDRDGWAWFLDQLTNFFSSVVMLPPPPEPPLPTLLAGRNTSREAHAVASPALQAAALLGRRTAELHLALSTSTQDPAFAAIPVTPESLRQDARRIESQFDSVLEILKSRFATFDEPTADAAVKFMSRRRDLASRIQALGHLQPAGQLIRIHGDYHLGQTLRTASNGPAGDFVFLDFEGEPARNVAERRQKQSALRDVAGMLRSFSYAAHSGLDRYFTSDSAHKHSGDIDRLTAWAILWERSVAAEFLCSYRETVATRPGLLPPPEQSQSLLNAYLLEKALYEVEYELNNRPAWLRIPLAGILAL